MNTRNIFPLAAVPLAALGLLTTALAASGLADSPTNASVDTRITDFPVVTVRPAPQDAAYFRAHRIVDVPRITVRPESADLALFFSVNTARIVHSPVLPPQDSALGRRMAVFSVALAAR